MAIRLNQFPSNQAREQFRQKLCALSARPKIYTPNGTFIEIVIYVNAFVDGCGYPTGCVNLEHGMLAFGCWLLYSRHCAQAEEEDCRSWDQMLLEYCSGDAQAAVAKLGTLYEEFLAKTHEQARRLG